MADPPRSEPAPEAILARALLAWVAASQRRPWRVLLLALATTGLLGAYAASNLGFNVDPNALFSKDLRFQRMIAEFSRYFPVLTDSLLIVVDGETPEATREAQEELRAALAQRTDAFHRVFLPGEEPFFERTGLLYGSVDEIEEFADNMAMLQPLIGELTQDPSLPTLTRLIQLGLADLDESGVDPERWEIVLDHFRTATVSVFDEFPVAVSWETVLLDGSGFDPTTLRVIVAEPILDLERVLAADTSIRVVRDTIAALNLGPERGVRVRITGYPAINHEEMSGLTADTALAGSVSLVLVVLVLTRAFRSWRLMLAAVITLIVGLVWSAAFTAFAVRELNPLSIAFGVLVIGLGVDFMIHLGMHFAEGTRYQPTLAAAMRSAVQKTGPALVLCASTTTVGFLAFVPTDYRGVSDLGLAASGGLVAMLFQTLTLFPALIRILIDPPALARLATANQSRTHALPSPPPLAVCGVAALLAIGALPLLPRVDLDTNVLRLRNPTAESVMAFEDLLDSRHATPWYVDALTPSQEEAERLAERLRELPIVDRVVGLADFVPGEQDEKLEILADVSLFLDLSEVAEPPEVPTEEQIEALTSLRDFLAEDFIAQSGSPLARSARLLRESLDAFLARVDDDDEAALSGLERVLLDPLPAHLDRLRENLDVGPIAGADLPAGLVARMRADDGHARLQIYPAESLWDHDTMVRFVETIRPVWGDITGLPVNLVESARATWTSLREALIWSALAITLLLLVLWRRIGDTLIALGPLLLAVLLTLVSTVLLPIPLGFGNVLVLPLLLGIGVDSGVHLIHRAHHLSAGPGELLSSTTARAVFYSALTTVASFGTLMLSSHRGIASLGELLVVGMIWTLAANLVLLPALLVWRQRASAKPARA